MEIIYNQRNDVLTPSNWGIEQLQNMKTGKISYVEFMDKVEAETTSIATHRKKFKGKLAMGTIRTLLLVVVILITSGISASAQSNPCEKEWNNHRIITITNENPSELTDYQVCIDLNASSIDFSKFKTDGGDVRLKTGKNESVPFWIEWWNPITQSARVWAKVPRLPALGQTTLHLCNGNPDASTASNGSETFLFFDDFTFTAPGYFELSRGRTVLRRESNSFETTAPHTLSVVKANRNGYLYWGYFGPSYWDTEDGTPGTDEKGWVGLAYSNDLVNWEQYPGNPLFKGSQERWPSVLLVDDCFFMAHTKDYLKSSYIVLKKSNNGIDFEDLKPSSIAVPGESGFANQNPALFKDPKKGGQFYLYWYRGDNSKQWSIRVKQASTVEGLIETDNSKTDNSKYKAVIGPLDYTIAAPQVMYYDGTYYLAVETETKIHPDNCPNGIWQTLVYVSDNPTANFKLLPGNPVLRYGSACFFQHIFGNTLHAYYCQRTPRKCGKIWTVDYRYADLTAGRQPVPIFDAAKWTTDGGTWQPIPSILSQYCSEVTALQGEITDKYHKILKSKSESEGTDYVVEASGRQILGRVLGIGIRATESSKLYSVNVYNNLDPDPNLYLYLWNDGDEAKKTLGRVSIGPIKPPDKWIKLTIKVHSKHIEVYVNNKDKPELAADDSTFPSGAYVALYGEEGTTAQFSTVFVRKYAAKDPTVSIGPEQQSK